MTEHNEDLCIGVATFRIDGETKQFGLTKDDLDFLKEREVKLQERLDETLKHLKHVKGEKSKLESKLAVIRQTNTSFQVKE